jgi:hypothetical protein
VLDVRLAVGPAYAGDLELQTNASRSGVRLAACWTMLLTANTFHRELSMKLSSLRGLLALAVAALMANGTAFGQAPTAAIDVVGIKLGMPMADAVAAIKADNPKLSVQTQTMTLEGFDQPFVTAIVATQSIESGKDNEQVTLLLTTPPNHQVVWGIQRTYHYGPQSMPSLDNALAGLRRKYGAENAILMDTDSRQLTKTMAWAYDTGGKLMSPAEGKALYVACATYLENHFSPIALNNDLHGMASPPQCKSVILAKAVALGAQGPAGAPVLGNLIVQVTNGAMYRASIDATRAVAMAAAQAREKKESKKIDQRGEPKL